MILRKRRNNGPKTQKYLAKLPSIYLVASWVHYGVEEFKFSGKFSQNKRTKEYVPLVWQYDNYTDSYLLKRITETTSGKILTWTMRREAAEIIANSVNKNEKVILPNLSRKIVIIKKKKHQY